VLASSSQAQSIGVTGVPGFLLDRRLLVLGAQPRELFEQAFEQLHAGP
jgi:predicted DsbA family dithiol-disulfide isomerase